MARLETGIHGLNVRVTVFMAHDCDCAAAQIPNRRVAGTIAIKVQTASRRHVYQRIALHYQIKQQRRNRQQVRTILKRNLKVAVSIQHR